MTIETEDYLTRDTMKTAKAIRVSNGWRSLHTDFIKNDESQGYHVTYVNGLDDPTPPPDLDRERAIELSNKLETDGSLTIPELNEFVKLKLVRNK